MYGSSTMKKIFTFASVTAIVMLLIGSVQFATAQKYTFSPSKDMTKAWTGTDDLGFMMYIENKTSEELKLSWKVVSNNMPAGWTYSICDNWQCYSSFQEDAQFAPVAKGGKAFFKFDVFPIEGQVVNATVQLGVFETGNPLALDVVSFSIQSSSSVEEPAAYSAGVSPNPAGESLTISAAAALNSLQIYSALGVKVMEIANANNAELTIDIRELPTGVYYIKALDIYGKTVATKFQKF